MKPCERYEAELSALVDGQLEADVLLPTLDHLCECRSCRDFYRSARGLGGLLAVLRDPKELPPLPVGGWQRIAQAASLETRWRQVRTKFLAAAAAVVFAVGLWTAQSALQTPSPTSESLPVAEIEIIPGDDSQQMTDLRFVELTTELLRSDRRYREKMQEVLHEVSARSFIPEGSNDATFPRSEEYELERSETEAEDAFATFRPLWW